MMIHLVFVGEIIEVFPGEIPHEITNNFWKITKGLSKSYTTQKSSF